MKRREFVRNCGVLAAGTALAGCSAMTGREEGSATVEYTEGGHSDLIVAGGGPAGIAAAVTAARLGRKVRLFEWNGCLGGVWTAGLLSCVLDFGKGDIAKEISERLEALGARTPRRAVMLERNYVLQPEYMKHVCEQMCSEAGVDFLLHCPVVAVEKDRSGRNITAVFTESKSGRQRWTADRFLDATGDGDLAARAGCGFDFGTGVPGENDQPATMFGIAVIDDSTRVKEFIVNDPSVFDSAGNQRYDPKKRFLEEVRRCGMDFSYVTLNRMYGNILSITCTHEFGLRVDDVRGITEATVRSRRDLMTLVRGLEMNGGPAWEGLRLVATSEQIGHRAARRIHGRYTVTAEDAANGAVHPDPVTISRFSIDIHAPTPDSPTYSNAGIKAKPFQIPFRACQAADLDNLYMAGRCISGDFIPMASYRVTGSAVEMGENVVKRIYGEPVSVPEE